VSVTAAGADVRFIAPNGLWFVDAAKSVCHLLCPNEGIRSRAGNRDVRSYTACGQLCGQLGISRGSIGADHVDPQRRPLVPTALHHLSTPATRLPACGDGAPSTLSTGLTTAVAVSSSRTLLLNNLGDERLAKWWGPQPMTDHDDRRHPGQRRCAGTRNTDPG
jgi:hypothetical protein